MATRKLLVDNYNLYLKAKGVRLPGEKSKLGCALECLVENMGQFNHIDTIREYVVNRGFKLSGQDTLQVRHLSTQNGFNIIKEGRNSHQLVNLTEPHPGFIPERRNIELIDTEWQNLLQEYNSMCVNCGSTQNEPLRWNPTETTTLQRGHMDPRLPLTLANCIPQCQFCNQRYRNRAVFDNRGMVRELLNN